MAAPADHVGLQPLAQLRSNIEESRAVRREQPLVSMHRQHVRLDAGGIEAQRAHALGSIDIQQDAASVQEIRHLGERRSETGVVIHRAQDDQTRPRVHRFVEPIPGTSGRFNAKAFQQAGRVEIVRELVLEREHVVARTPVEPREQQPQRGGRIRNERDILRRAVDQPADLRANAIGVVIPGEEIRARQFIAMREVMATASVARRGNWPNVAVLR